MGFLYQVTIILAAAVLVVPLFRRLGFGAILGYLAAGVVIGPWGLRLANDPDAILRFGEIGVVFLLFLIGLEVQPSRLRVLRRSIFGLGSAQVLICGSVGSTIAWFLTHDLSLSLVAGFGLALSSTAFVLQLLAEKKQLTSPPGRAALGVLLFQDIAVIAMIAALPLLAGGSDMQPGRGWLVEIARDLAVIVIFVLVARYLLRPALRVVAATGTHELFTAASLLIVIGAALAMESIGFSAALGAFGAGVLVADSEYRHQLEADITPVKGLLVGLFFMAVGMSANLGLLVTDTMTILALTALVVISKMVLMYPLGRLYGLRNGHAITLSILLSQGGEFAFILFAAAGLLGVLPRTDSQLLIVVVTLSMAATPILLWCRERLAKPETVPDRPFDKVEVTGPRVIIAGFGRVGQIVGRLLSSLRIPFAALDRDAAQVDLVRRFGNPAYFGDPRRLDILRSAHVDQAELFVIAVGEPASSLEIAASVKRHFPHLKVLARARNRQHAQQLRALGCEYIMRDTLLSSLDLARETLFELGFDKDDAISKIAMFREHDERTLDRQYAVRDDEAAIIQSAREAAAELRELFETDHKSSG